MSRLLVRKAFELLQDEIKSENINVKRKEKAVGLPRSRHQMKKQPKGSKLSEDRRYEVLSFVGKKKSPIDEYKEKHMIDRTEENLRILMQLKSLKPKTSAAQKVLNYHQKQQQKRIIEPEVQKPEPQSILFPEENEGRKKKRKKK